ncbi:Ig-like domain-containing protein [Clostridium saccharoperbutylacetonicum]
MKNYLKKFSIMFMMALILVCGYSISAFADDSYIIGTANLGNTVENSANVGDKLTDPEVGWKRYDDTNAMFKRTGTWYTDDGRYAENTGKPYNGSDQFTKSTDSTLSFEFYGTNLRIIAAKSNDQSTNIRVKIDGVSYEVYSAYFSNPTYQVLVKEIDGLAATNHKVTMSSESAGDWQVDAIDVMIESKYLTLDKSTMNLTEGDSGQLTAITTPSAVGVTWTSSDPSIATIEVDSTNGKLIKVDAIKEGTCTITATTADGSNLSASCIINVTKKTEPIPTPDSQPTDTEYITNIAHAKGVNTNNPGGEVTIIFHGSSDTTLSLVKTADVKDVWIGDNFTYTLLITNTGTKTAKAVVVNDPAPNHIDFNVSGVTTTQGSVDSSSTSKNIIVNIGDILPGGTVTIKIPSTVIV